MVELCMRTNGDDAIAEFYIVSPSNFPGGLRCTRCGREIACGMPYKESLTGLVGQGVESELCVELVCVYETD